MVIVGGSFAVEPGLREEYIAERSDLMRRSRAERGCLEYTFSADPLDPGRVVLFERWESRADLDAHLDASRAQPLPVTPQVPASSSVITVYDVSGESPLSR